MLILEKRKSQVNNLSSRLKKPEKEEQNKPKVRRMKIKLIVKINEIEKNREKNQ